MTPFHDWSLNKPLTVSFLLHPPCWHSKDDRGRQFPPPEMCIFWQWCRKKGLEKQHFGKHELLQAVKGKLTPFLFFFLTSPPALWVEQTSLEGEWGLCCHTPGVTKTFKCLIWLNLSKMHPNYRSKENPIHPCPLHQMELLAREILQRNACIPEVITSNTLNQKAK